MMGRHSATAEHHSGKNVVVLDTYTKEGFVCDFGFSAVMTLANTLYRV
jgi:hypothetical protein